MIALYPGAFKPPHRGHFDVVKDLLGNTYNGKVYDIDNYLEAGEEVLKGAGEKIKDINQVVVFIGGKTRNGITPEDSEKIWNIYKKYLGNVEVVLGEMNPMYASSKYAKDRPNEEFYAITGVRGNEDLVDLKRVTTYKNRDNVDGLAVTTNKSKEVRATNFRNAILSGNLDNIRDFFPKEISREDILNIVKMLKSSIIAEELNKKIEETITETFKNENNSGAPIAPRSIIKSKDRAYLVNVFDKLRDMDDKLIVSFNQDHIRIDVKEKDDLGNKFDYTPFFGSLLEYMVENKLNITPLPEVKLRRDIKEASDFFGRTAFYDPNINEIVIYVEGRHPKDVMRSFTHEMVHHIQNLEGRMTGVHTNNTNESERLLELEKEAYTKGNLIFRKWEDSVKNK
tara:strand:- start:2230 stop:3420 length:1191 start_codon:yes stop_codon:yes gene_type:complete